MTERDRQVRRSLPPDRKPSSDAIADHAAPLAISNSARVRGGSLLHGLAHPSAHALGNQARARLARGELRPLARTTRTIQTKSLRVGVGDSPLERQADAVADADARRVALPAITPVSSGAQGITPGPQFVRDLSNAGGGRPLMDGVRGELEQQFGHDLGPVRVHDGPEASDLNRRIHARAFTHGADVFLGAGQPDLASAAGRRLLAHEVTHVIQQQGAGGAVIQRAGTGDMVETPADFLKGLHRALDDAPSGVLYSGMIDLLGDLQRRTDELIDIRCFKVLNELMGLFRTLYMLPPTPLDQVLTTQRDKDFVATLAQRDRSHDEVIRLQAEKAGLEKRAQNTPWYKRRPTADLARADAAITDEARAGFNLDRTLQSEYEQSGSHIENLLVRSADSRVRAYPEAFRRYDELCREHMPSGEGVLVRMVARKVAHHLGDKALEYYRSVRGKRYL